MVNNDRRLCSEPTSDCSARPSVNRRVLIAGLAATLAGFLEHDALRADSDVDLRFGVNLSVIDIDTAKVPFCSIKNEHHATFVGHAFLPRYRTALVRDSVRRTLKALRDRNIGSIRCLLWFDKARSPSGDTCSVRDGDLLGDNLSEFAEDMSEAGLEQLMVAFSPQGIHSPSCRRTSWGDCFSESTVEQTADFILDVRKGFNAPTRMSLWFDLINEGIPANNLPEVIRMQFLTYMKSVVPLYRKNFPRDRISASMQGGQIKDRLGYLLENFDHDGAGADFYSIHLYKSAGDARSVLKDFFPTIAKRPRPLFIGEIENDRDYYLAVDAFLRESVPREYRGILVWPLHNPKNQCAIDTEPRDIEFR
jgi:hypothetical protein